MYLIPLGFICLGLFVNLLISRVEEVGSYTVFSFEGETETYQNVESISTGFPFTYSEKYYEGRFNYGVLINNFFFPEKVVFNVIFWLGGASILYVVAKRENSQ